MRKVVILFFTLVITLSIGNVTTAQVKSNCIPTRHKDKSQLAFKAGETLSFTMHYRWGIINSDVGTAKVVLDSTLFNGVPVYHVSVTGRTTPLYDLFFKVREDFQSWFTVDELRPIKFTRNTLEGKYRARNSYFYHWNLVEPIISASVFTSSSGSRYVDLPLDECTYDLPALFFLARNMDLTRVVPGERYPMTFAIDDDIYNVYFILLGKEVKRIKGVGTFKTIKFAAKLLAGEVFTGEEDMLIWITDDDNRIPVYFEAPILVGVASGRITGYSGLKHPLKSLISKK